MRYFLMVLVLFVMVVGCTKETTPQVESEPTAQVEEKSPVERVMEMPNMTAALAMTMSEMGNRYQNVSPGTALFASWAMKHMSPQDVITTNNEVTFGLAMKDIVEARGKRMCVTGYIIELEIMNLPLGKMGTGKLMDEDRNIYNLLAVRSTGTLVEQDEATFCGIITEKYDYLSSDDMTRHALTLVGMFALPENIY